MKISSVLVSFLLGLGTAVSKKTTDLRKELMYEENEAECMHYFSSLDVDKDNVLSTEDLKAAVNEEGVDTNEARFFAHYLGDADYNKNGQIDKEEFMIACNQQDHVAEKKTQLKSLLSDFLEKGEEKELEVFGSVDIFGVSDGAALGNDCLVKGEGKVSLYAVRCREQHECWNPPQTLDIYRDCFRRTSCSYKDNLEIYVNGDSYANRKWSVHNDDIYNGIWRCDYVEFDRRDLCDLTAPLNSEYCLWDEVWIFPDLQIGCITITAEDFRHEKVRSFNNPFMDEYTFLFESMDGGGSNVTLIKNREEQCLELSVDSNIISFGGCHTPPQGHNQQWYMTDRSEIRNKWNPLKCLYLHESGDVFMQNECEEPPSASVQWELTQMGQIKSLNSYWDRSCLTATEDGLRMDSCIPGTGEQEFIISDTDVWCKRCGYGLMKTPGNNKCLKEVGPEMGSEIAGVDCDESDDDDDMWWKLPAMGTTGEIKTSSSKCLHPFVKPALRDCDGFGYWEYTDKKHLKETDNPFKETDNPTCLQANQGPYRSLTNNCDDNNPDQKFVVDPCGRIDVVGEWVLVKHGCTGCTEQSITYTKGIEHEVSNVVTETWGSSVANTFSIGFEFDFGLEIGGEISTEITRSVESSVGKAVRKNAEEEETMVIPPGLVWQFQYHVSDNSGICGAKGSSTVFEFSYGATPALDEKPCCLPGTFKTQAGTAHSPCRDGYPCLCLNPDGTEQKGCNCLTLTTECNYYNRTQQLECDQDPFCCDKCCDGNWERTPNPPYHYTCDRVG